MSTDTKGGDKRARIRARGRSMKTSFAREVEQLRAELTEAVDLLRRSDDQNEVLRGRIAALELNSVVKVLEIEKKRLKQWVNDLQAGMYINCVYCGHRYGPNSEVPASMADVLKEHIERCPEHPLSHANAKLGRIQTRLKKISDTSEVAESVELADEILEAEFSPLPSQDASGG